MKEGIKLNQKKIIILIKRIDSLDSDTNSFDERKEINGSLIKEKVAEKNTQTNNDINNQKNEENEIFLGKTILNKYRIEKKIRRGSQAQIYLGENIRTFEQYAIKVEKNKEENCLMINFKVLKNKKKWYFNPVKI